MVETPTSITLMRGWRRSMTGAWYRRRQKWVAIVVADADGFRLVLKRTERTFEDALAVANEILTDGN